jgi:hypothetical protein
MPKFVLDSNALLDFYTNRDFADVYDAKVRALGTAADDDPQVVYRRARARESLLLAIYLHNVGATTYSLQGEVITKLTEAAPPHLEGGVDLVKDHTSFVIHFVKDYVLSRWKALFIQPKGQSNDWPKLIQHPDLQKGALQDPTAKEVLEPTGSRADLFHIAMAKRRGALTLVTNEGFCETGYEAGKITKWAAKEGIRSVFPKDVYADKLNERSAAEIFMRRFRGEAERYIAKRREEIGPDLGYEVITWMEGFYRHVLFGHTAGREDPVRVSVR